MWYWNLAVEDLLKLYSIIPLLRGIISHYTTELCYLIHPGSSDHEIYVNLSWSSHTLNLTKGVKNRNCNRTNIKNGWRLSAQYISWNRKTVFKIDDNFMPHRSTLIDHINYKDCHQNSNSEHVQGNTKKTTEAW